MHCKPVGAHRKHYGKVRFCTKQVVCLRCCPQSCYPPRPWQGRSWGRAALQQAVAWMAWQWRRLTPLLLRMAVSHLTTGPIFSGLILCL